MSTILFFLIWGVLGALVFHYIAELLSTSKVNNVWKNLAIMLLCGPVLWLLLLVVLYDYMKDSTLSVGVCDDIIEK